ncbi:hypothetical protein [Nonomuraea sp. NPDC002799]
MTAPTPPPASRSAAARAAIIPAEKMAREAIALFAEVIVRRQRLPGAEHADTDGP